MSSPSASLPLNGHPEPPTKRQRRPRASQACDTCRTRKVKCDGELPCYNCAHHTFDCSYKDRPSPISVSQQERAASATDYPCKQAKPKPSKPLQRQYAPLLSSSDAQIAPVSPASLAHSTPSGSLIVQPSGVEEEILSTQQKDEGVGDINCHTDGAEFYGRTGTFYFLSRLRSKANLQALRRSGHAVADGSVVNLLHSSEYSASAAVEDPVSIYPPENPQQHSPQSNNPPYTASKTTQTLSNLKKEIQTGRECARLYFVNLHRIHPILDQSSFISRCEREIWADGAALREVPSSLIRARNRFLALYNIVVAIGAITADESSLVMWEGIADYLEEMNRRSSQIADTPPYLPIRAARHFFEQAKLYLEDTFESSSFETAQTLFLMSVFCQNALKPHSCYMYSGMAVRTAFAIGIPTSLHSNTSPHSLLWWALYSHEIEMCISAGRQSFLREAGYYSIPLPRPLNAAGPSPSMLINCMVDMAQVLIEISANSSPIDDDATALDEKSSKSVYLDTRLSHWKANLPSQLDFENWSMEDAELTSKQKIVIKLRYLNARILVHRSFLITASAESYKEKLAVHTVACVEAARETIRFVHEIYLHRPYFRTWWYNCTYVLDATMVLLYVVLSDIYPMPDDTILQYVEKSLQIFASMKTLAVARRCAEVTKEVLSIAKRMHNDRTGQPEKTTRTDGGSVPEINFLAPADNFEPGEHAENMAFSEGDLYAGLMDTNLVFNYLNFEDWNAWVT
ncbi:hypothetical protein BX600DRAFT_496703 [Xylariales sp. PMI_506]|nr:hypothetical protein BX600DRAFT_496703 [Xylariales sp. PMI_506]